MTVGIGNVCINTTDTDASVAFWRAVTGYEVTSSGDGLTCLGAPDGSAVGLSLQLVADLGGEVGGNRLHLDLLTDDLVGEVARIRALGASEIARHDGWVVLADLEGNHFCVAAS